MRDDQRQARIPVENLDLAARDRGAQDAALVRKAQLYFANHAGNPAILLECAHELPRPSANAGRRRHAPDDANRLPLASMRLL